MSRLEKEQDNNYSSKEKDIGMEPEYGSIQTINSKYFIYSTGYYEYNLYVNITDAVLNQLRRMLRDGVNLSIRMHS